MLVIVLANDTTASQTLCLGDIAAQGGSASSDKRIYSRDEITRLYEQKRRGAYVGRETAWMRLENDIMIWSGFRECLTLAPMRPTGNLAAYR